LYSQVLGKEQAYSIGKLCDSSRKECENIFFKDYLNKINTLQNESRTFFSKIFIQEDQIGYTGDCPCPYNSDSRGGSCGGRSSYSKRGKISYCYDRDVSNIQIADRRASMIAKAHKNLNDAVQNDLNVYHENYTLILIVIFYSTLFYFFKFKGNNHLNY